MIDNLPFYTEDLSSMLKAYRNELLVFVENKEKVNTKTGEIYFIHNRRYLNLFFSFEIGSDKKIKKLIVRGSIHTYSNNGLHNANILTFHKFKKTLIEFSKLFGIDLYKCVLKPLEYGNNLFLDYFSNFIVDDIIENTICINRKMFNRNAGIETSLISGTSQTEVRTKAYSKSADYPKYCNNTIRYEDKLSKIRGLNVKNIVFVSDLLQIKVHLILLEKHLKNISKIVLFDYTMIVPKKNRHYALSMKLNNPNFWRKLIKKCKEKKVHDTKYNETIEILNSLSLKFGSNILHLLLQQIEKQSIKSLGLCCFCREIITLIPKYAQPKKTKYAQSYIMCNPCNDISTAKPSSSFM